MIHAAPESTVTFCGAPTVVTRTIAFVRGSISYTLSSRWFTTQTAWALASDKALPGLTAIVFVSVGGPGSIRQSTPANGSVTQTAPAATARSLRVPAARRILRVTRFERGSIRTIAPLVGRAAVRPVDHPQGAGAAAIAVAAIPSIVATTSFVRASTREIVDFPLIAQTLPFASARCV